MKIVEREGPRPSSPALWALLSIVLLGFGGLLAPQIADAVGKARQKDAMTSSRLLGTAVFSNIGMTEPSNLVAWAERECRAAQTEGRALHVLTGSELRERVEAAAHLDLEPKELEPLESLEMGAICDPMPRPWFGTREVRWVDGYFIRNSDSSTTGHDR